MATITIQNAITDHLYGEIVDQTPEGIFNVIRGTNPDFSDLCSAILWWNNKESNQNIPLAKYCICLEIIRNLEQIRLNELYGVINLYSGPTFMNLPKDHWREQFARAKEFKHLLTVPNQMCIKFDDAQEQFYEATTEIGNTIPEEKLQRIYTAAWSNVLKTKVFNQQISLLMPELHLPGTPVFTGGLRPYFRDFAFYALCDGLITPFQQKIEALAMPPIRANTSQLIYLAKALEGKEVDRLFLTVYDIDYDCETSNTITKMVEQCRVKHCTIGNLPDHFVKSLQIALSKLNCTLHRTNYS